MRITCRAYSTAHCRYATRSSARVDCSTREQSACKTTGSERTAASKRDCSLRSSDALFSAARSALSLPLFALPFGSGFSFATSTRGGERTHARNCASKSVRRKRDRATM